MVSKNRKDEGSLSKLRLCNIVMSDSYWLETSKTNYADFVHILMFEENVLEYSFLFEISKILVAIHRFW